MPFWIICGESRGARGSLFIQQRWKSELAGRRVVVVENKEEGGLVPRVREWGSICGDKNISKFTLIECISYSL